MKKTLLLLGISLVAAVELKAVGAEDPAMACKAFNQAIHVETLFSAVGDSLSAELKKMPTPLKVTDARLFTKGQKDSQKPVFLGAFANRDPRTKQITKITCSYGVAGSQMVQVYLKP